MPALRRSSRVARYVRTDNKCRFFSLPRVITSVVILALGSQQPMHHAADWVVPHLGEQMNMIRHQAIRINVKGKFRFLPLEQVQKLEMVIG